MTQVVRETVVAPGRECIGCRYDLRGLPTSSVCPECGLAIKISLSRKTRFERALDLYALAALVLVVVPLSMLVVPASLLLIGGVGWYARSERVRRSRGFQLVLLALTISTVMRGVDIVFL